MIGPRSRLSQTLVNDDSPDSLTFVHESESLIDLIERERVSDHGIDLDLPRHIPVDDFGHVRPPTGGRSGNCRPFQSRPVTTWKGLSRNLLSRARNADDNRLNPSSVGRLKRLPHDGDISCAIECVVGAADLIRSTNRCVALLPCLFSEVAPGSTMRVRLSAFPRPARR
jgi:hypothetical protein